MNSHKRYIQYRKDELYHHNYNHDPRNGQFTSGKGLKGVIERVKNKFANKTDKTNRVAEKTDFDGDRTSVRPSTTEEELKALAEMERDAEITVDLGKSLTDKAGFKLETVYNDYQQFNKDVVVKDSSGNSVKHELTIDYDSIGAGTNKDKLLSDVSKIEKNLASIDKSVRSQIASKIFEEGKFPIEYERDSSGNLREKPFSVKTKEELADKLGTWDGKRTGSTIDFHPASEKYNAHAQIYYDDGGLWGGHFIVAEYDLDKNKVERYSIEG